MSVDTDEILSLSGGRFQDFVATLSPEQAQAVQSQMETRMADAGQFLIQQGDESEFTLFIEEGAVEVIVGEPSAKPVSYLGRGDVIGELGMLNQQPRNAHIRASSPVVYKVIYAEAFKQLMAEVPGFAIFFAGRMARMVKGSKPSRQHSSNCTDLGGKLPNFDLLAVLYTIASSGSSGELAIMNEENNKIGNLFIQEGIVTYAQFRNLASLEASYQMLSEHLIGSFSFSPDATLGAGSNQACAVTVSIEKLVQKATEIREELTTFPPGIMNLQGTLKVLSPEDPGAPADQRARNELIIGFCNEGVSDLPTLWERSGYCLYHFVKTIHYMSTIGMVRLN
ncbi:MAG: cyclic nucleotide-binding domain-containing protein [Verrucomicrobiota bacterium]